MLKKIGFVYTEDWRSILLLLLALLAIYLPFFVFINSYLIVLWIYVSSWLYTLVTLINHNHQHCHVFKSKVLNRILDILISAVLFTPSCIIVLAHNINHHQYSGGKEDWIGIHIAGIGSGFERLLRCYLVGFVKIKQAQKLASSSAWPKGTYKLLKIERYLVILWVLILLYIDWAALVLFALIPLIIGLQRLFEYNHILHDNGCEFSKIETASHNATSKLGNWFLFNGGFHTAHHKQPQLHWSLLPALHEQEKNKIPTQYLHHSVFAFYIRYLFTKKDRLE